MTQATIYLDYNATTPIDPEVADAMLPFLHGHFGNPSSSHSYGIAAKRAVETARAEVAALIGALPEEIVFTSGGSESNNMAIFGAAEKLAEKGRHLITSAVEHPAVLEPCRTLAHRGCELSVIPVDDGGQVDPAVVARALRPDTVLVTIMHANNEVGTLQPIAEIAKLTNDCGVWLHTDAAQSVGKIPVDVSRLGVDFLSIAGHKFYGPKGVGALYLRRGREIPSLIHGAGHESNRRAGTENVLEIVGLGCAARLAAERLAETMAHSRHLRDRLLSGLRAHAGALQVNGDLEGGLPNTLSVSFRGVDGGTLLARLGGRLAASAGAACHAEGVTLSTVLEAMRIPAELARGTVRFSVGRMTTETEIDEAVKLVGNALD